MNMRRGEFRVDFANQKCFLVINKDIYKEGEIMKSRPITGECRVTQAVRAVTEEVDIFQF